MKLFMAFLYMKSAYSYISVLTLPSSFCHTLLTTLLKYVYMLKLVSGSVASPCHPLASLRSVSLCMLKVDIRNEFVIEFCSLISAPFYFNSTHTAFSTCCHCNSHYN